MAEATQTAAARRRGGIGQRIARKLAAAPAPEPIAEGVWVLRGGFPGRNMNVYLVRDGAGVLAFDAGIRPMADAIRDAADELGGLTRVVLGHGHTDHRGAAPALGVPVLCHVDEVADAEGSGGFRYWPADLAGVPLVPKLLHRFLHPNVWDGGPVKIAETLNEGDEVAGFVVVHLPGHAPGLIALWRESDRLALCTDAFYVLDLLGGHQDPSLPHPTYNWDTEQARASLRKLAALDPAIAAPGHLGPLTGDVRAQLEQAAA